MFWPGLSTTHGILTTVRRLDGTLLYLAADLADIIIVAFAAVNLPVCHDNNVAIRLFGSSFASVFVVELHNVTRVLTYTGDTY